jgi:sulfatase modifying factor 1
MAFLVIAVMLAARTLSVDAISQTNTARLSLEQSTNGLTNWQRVPLTAEMLNNGDIDLPTASSNSFYRMKIAMPTPTPPPPTINMITVQGGTLPQSSSRVSGRSVATFMLGKYEITWNEWQEIRAWAVTNGYTDLADVGAGSAGNHPVRRVPWNEAVKWCNAWSEKEGLAPVYLVNGAVYRTGLLERTNSSTANGYRLPTEAEWEWAARGGVKSQGFIFSGSNELNDVAWHYGNSSGAPVNIQDGYGTWPIGLKRTNELGFHDMTGNVSEWCWDRDETFVGNRRYRGGSYQVLSFPLANSDGANIFPATVSDGIGLRAARNAP